MPRPRLLEALASARLGLVEAPGGFGKSVLAAELTARLEAPELEADLVGPVSSPALLVAALRRGAARTGHSDLAAALALVTDEDPRAAGAAAAAALGGRAEPLLVVVDEAQLVEGDAATALATLADGIVDPVRLLVIGRRLPAALAALRGAAITLDAAALAFSPDEVGGVLAAALGEQPSPAEIAALHAMAHGWPTLTVLAAERLARAPAGARLRLAGSRRTLALLVDEVLQGVDPAVRSHAAQLGHLALLSPEIVDAIAGTGAFEALVGAGLPIAPRRDGWYELPGRLREELADRGPLAVATATAAARHYALDGELATAIQLLARGGAYGAAADLLATSRLDELEDVGVPLLVATLALLPDETLRARPEGLLRAIHVSDLSRAKELRRRLLARGVEVTPPDAPVRRALDAERAIDLAVEGRWDAALALADDVLRRVGPADAHARGRGLLARALVGVYSGEATTFATSERDLEEAAAVFEMLGERRWVGEALAFLAFHFRYWRGDLTAARATMAAALACLPEPRHDRAAWLTFAVEVAAYAGDLTEAEAAHAEAAAIGRALGDRHVIAYAAWTGAMLAAARGDRAATAQQLELAESNRSDWYEHGSGVMFLADAAAMLARLGDAQGAHGYLARAEARATADDLRAVTQHARGVWEARYGDAQVAEAALVGFQTSLQMQPRDVWRVLLERAGAAERGGERERAAALAHEAFAAARVRGLEHLPSLHAPDLVARLAPLLAGTATTGLPETARSIVVATLGGFGVSVDGRRADPPPGRTATLVKLLAVADGPIPVDAALEALWPDGDPVQGRRRLRNVLLRIRATCGELVERRGEALALAAGVDVDLHLLDRDARAALAAAGDEREALARAALSRYRGELLPEDRYAPWVDAPRQALRGRVLDLLDVLADAARERGALDDAVRLLDQAIVLAPDDEARYLLCAELLLVQGRRGTARELIDRVVGLRAALGLPRGARLERLVAATRPAA